MKFNFKEQLLQYSATITSLQAQLEERDRTNRDSMVQNFEFKTQQDGYRDKFTILDNQRQML